MGIGPSPEQRWFLQDPPLIRGENRNNRPERLQRGSIITLGDLRR